ncbi:type II secretion system protein, partial [bacterium]|nr:type II secretion system protein [bacterium]
RSGLSFIGALLHRRQIFDWKHHALVLISYVKNLRNRRSLLLPLRGFTLAEVLITLGIIGVVAALTIPTLMQKTNEKELISGAKKAYNMLSNAYALAQAEHGSPTSWNPVGDASPGEADWYYGSQYLLENLKVIKSYGNTNNVPNCFANSYAHASSSTESELFDNADWDVYSLSDGSCIALYNCSWDRSPVYIDINGNKGPNEQGKDLFEMNLDPESGKITPSYENANLADFGCSEHRTNCIFHILKNDNMSYLDN